MRPNISFATGQLSGHCYNPMCFHLVDAKRVLRYLNKTLENEIEYRAGEQWYLVAYVNSDFTGEHVHRKCTTGYILKFSNCTVS